MHSSSRGPGRPTCRGTSGRLHYLRPGLVQSAVLTAAATHGLMRHQRAEGEAPAPEGGGDRAAESHPGFGGGSPAARDSLRLHAGTVLHHRARWRRASLFDRLLPARGLPRGDAVSLRPRPKGVFTLEEKFPVHLMVATVTGIAPFVSMLRHVIHRGERRFRFVVLQGASYQDEFAYREKLEAASARHPELLAYIPTVSHPGEERNRGCASATGRVNTVVEEHVERLGLPAESTAAYACGR